MRRRTFFGAAVAAALAPVAARGQRRRPKVIAYLCAGPKDAAFFDGVIIKRLAELGWVEGRDVVIAARWAENDSTKLPVLAAELGRLRPDVFVTVAGLPALEVKKLGLDTPIVGILFDAPDLVGPRLDRPAGTVTGILAPPEELLQGGAGEQFNLVRELLPSAHHIGWLEWTSAEADYESAFQVFQQRGVEAVVIPLATSFDSVQGRTRLARLATAARLPSVHGLTTYVDVGGLAAIGSNTETSFRDGLDMVDQVLRGAKPADIPVASPRLELAVNLNAADAIGLRLPEAVLRRAAKVVR